MRMATCHPDRGHHSHGLCQKCYMATPARKAISAAYYATPQGKAVKATYNAKPAVSARKAAYMAAYRASPKRPAQNAAYRATPQAKATQAAYKASPKGKATQAAYMAAYNASPKGKAQHTTRYHTRRARKAGNGGSHTAAEWIALCWSSRWCCAYCEIGVAKPELDHRIPICRGGSNDISNIAVACGPCNRRKGRMTDVEFMERNARLALALAA